MEQDINLYIFKPVLVTLNSSIEEYGTMVFIGQDHIIINSDDGDKMIALSEIRDVEYVSTISDFHTYGKYGEIGGFGNAYCFFIEDILSEAFRSYIVNNEYCCTAACHLYAREQENGKIFAKDVRLIRWTHVLHYSTLQRNIHIYIYQNGDIRVGMLVVNEEGEVLRLFPEGETIFVKDSLEKILPLPNTGEAIIVKKKDGTCIDGNYNGFYRQTIALLSSGGVALIDLSEIDTIRFKGFILPSDPSVSSRNLMIRRKDCESISYVLKIPCLRYPVDTKQLVAGMPVEFEPSMISIYPIAKDVLVDAVLTADVEIPIEERRAEIYTGLGVILNFKSDPTEMGSISDNITVKPYEQYFTDTEVKRRIKITYTSNIIDFDYDNTQINVVEFTCAQRPTPNKWQPAFSVKLIRTYPKRDYAYVAIDEQGNIQAIPVETAYLKIGARSNPGRRWGNIEVKITCADGKTYHGYLMDCTDEKAVVQCNFDTVEIALKDICEVRYYSVITYNQTDQIRVSSPFQNVMIHINDMIGEEDKTLFSSNIVGWVISYRLKQNYRKNQPMKGLMGIEGKLYQERKSEGRICYFDRDRCVIVDLDQHEENYHLFLSSILTNNAAINIGKINNAESVQQQRGFSCFDYPIDYRTRIRGKKVYAVISYVDSNPNRATRKAIRYGYLCGMEGDLCLLRSIEYNQYTVFSTLYEFPEFSRAKSDYLNTDRKVKDWRVHYIIARSMGVECVLLLYINNSAQRPKELQRGYLVEYAGDSCSIVKESDYGKAFEPTSLNGQLLFLNADVRMELSKLDPNHRDYPVSYLPCRRDDQEGIALMSLGKGHIKLRYGYIVKYLPNKSCGFITDEVDLQVKLRNPNARCNSDKHFHASVVRGNIPENIGKNTCYYEVAYALDISGRVCTVSFKREISMSAVAPFYKPASVPSSVPAAASVIEPAPVATPAQIPVPTPAPVPAPAVLRQEETINLRELLTSNSGIYQEAEVRYGFINMAFTKFGWINPAYCNKRYQRDEGMPERSIMAVFTPNKARYIGLNESRLKTTNQTYVVRYVEKGTMVNQMTNESYPTIDYDYPIEIIKVITKNQCVRADLSQDHEQLIITWNAAKLSDSVSESVEVDHGRSSEVRNELLPLTKGESLLIDTQKVRLYDIFIQETDTAYVLKTNGSIPKSDVLTLYRFGIITDFREGNDATLNGITEFSASILEPQVYNILMNNAFVQLHIVYTCKENQVNHVRRITSEEMQLIPFFSGRVTQYSATARQLVIDNGFIHCISVSTNPIVRDECMKGSILNREVYLRCVRHPFFDEGSDEAELMPFAVDVQCTSAVLKVQYDTGFGSYKAIYQGTVGNEMYALFAPDSYLKPLEGQSVLMDIAPNDIGDELVAFVHGQDFSEESIVFDEGIHGDDIKDMALSRLLLDNTKLKNIQLLDNNKRDANGMPINVEYASEALRILNGRPRSSEETIIAKYLICEHFPDVRIPSDRSNSRPLSRDAFMLDQLRSLYESKCSQVGKTTTFTCAEYSYLLVTLLPVARSSNFVGNRRVARAYSQDDCLYRLFLMDFVTRDEVQHYSYNAEKPHKLTNISSLLNCDSANNIQNFVAHLLMVMRTYPESLSANLAKMNPMLFASVLEYIRGIDSTLVAEDVNTLIRLLSSKYEQLRKRFLQDMEDISDDFTKLLSVSLDELAKCFLKLVCEEDKHYFDDLRNLVGRLITYRSKAGFTAQEVELIEIYRGLDDLESAILNHPGKESLELIVMNNGEKGPIARLKGIVSAILNEMYKSTDSLIQLEPNYTEISRGQKLTQFVLYNGDTRHSFRKTITNISIEIRSLTEGVSVVNVIPPQSLVGGESDEVTVYLSISPSFTGEISFEWSASYRSGVAFQNGKTVFDILNQAGRPVHKEREKLWTVMDTSLQIGMESSEIKKQDVDNPYRSPAEGNALQERDRDMFVGRNKEKQSIMQTIIRETDGMMRFIPGSTVILYGQRKCGKTSLINILCSDIRKNTMLNEQAIIITFIDILHDICSGPERLSGFSSGLYYNILKRFFWEIHSKHPDIENMLKENDIVLPNSKEYYSGPHNYQIDCFDTILQRFKELDQGRHTVVLIMDEFTRLCTSIADIVEAAPENAPEKQYAHIPSFIRAFSQNYGFVQIIIGHESMMRAFGRLGTLNHTAEFAEKVELHALEPDDARELIVNPMQRIFGYNVYRTPLGGKAIERLMDLSGCSPTFLMRLCRDVFSYYVKSCPSTQITDRDIRNVIAERLNSLTEDDFDIIITEDGDGAGRSEEKKTYKFLFATAKCSITEGSRTADENKIRAELNWDADEYMRVRDLLHRRHVISLAGYGRIRINNGLFLEYVRKRIN